jgi:Cyclic GMP-AMP synthase DncV-like, nucleotidyltransferase domain/Cyclic GMP-AMP synthase, C-terminal domain
MADLQKQFEKFHENIRLSEKNEKAKLQEKRNLLVSDLKDGLKKQAEENDEECLKFVSFNQGSYAMSTGIKPINDDYDIDVGIIFDNTEEDFDNPVQLKKKVRDALNSNFRTVKIRRPCVTVIYHKDGESEYHVDMAIYVKDEYDEECLYLAIGRENSDESNQDWSEQDPKGLINKINNRFIGDDRKQFKRIIRYLKKWRDKNFINGGAPISIGLTCASYHWFSPSKQVEYSDLNALLTLTEAMLNEFDYFTDRLEVELPVNPRNDLFGGMTDKQMEIFQEKLESLKEALIDVKRESSKSEACKILRKQFGDDFPVSDDGKVKQSSTSPVVTTGTSA